MTLNESPTSLQIQLTKSFFFFRGLTFRSAYREVGDLVVHLSAPVLAVTATITKYIQNDIFKTLHLDVDNCTVVAELPDR